MSEDTKRAAPQAEPAREGGETPGHWCEGAPETLAKIKGRIFYSNVGDLEKEILNHAASMERRLTAALREQERLKGVCTDWRVNRDGFEKAYLETLQRADLAEAERDEAVSFIRVIGEELIVAGYQGGDRQVTLTNIRAALKELTAANVRLKAVLAVPIPYTVDLFDQYIAAIRRAAKGE